METLSQLAERVRGVARRRGVIVKGETVAVSDVETAASPRPSDTHQIVQLKFWNDRVRGLPNPMARSALFTASNKPRQQLKNTEIVSSSEFKLFYTGEELRQIDEDVFLQLIHCARMRPLGEVVEISGYQLLKALGWSFDSRAYKRLRDSIERLTNGNIKINFATKAKAGYIGSMIRKVLWSGESAGTTKWRIYLEPEIISLFDADSYSLILWEQRLGLRDLAKWLLSFYYTHAIPFPYKVETIYSLCGSGAKSMNHFRADLKIALQDLQNAGFLDSWAITDKDLVEVVRNKPAITDKTH